MFVARAAPDMILVRHDAIPVLGMASMDLMAVKGDRAALDRARLAPGDRVRLAVKQVDETLVLLHLDKLP